MRSRRSASILLEATLAIALLTIAFVVVAHVLALAGRQRRETQWHNLATLEAANVLERMMARSWDDLGPGAQSIAISQEAGARLPEPRLNVEVEAAEGPVSSRRIHVQVDWINLAG